MVKSDARPLTPREGEILAALKNAMQYKEIAIELGISVETVRHHIKNLYRKLGVASKAEAILFHQKSKVS